MGNRFVKLIMVAALLFVAGCDMSEFVTKSLYENLKKDYDALLVSHGKLKTAHDTLAQENKSLKETIAKYKGGFETMYK